MPKNGLRPARAWVVLTPSAAVMSGFCRTVPPVEVKLPGVIGVPLTVKNTRRGPSLVNRSGFWALVNGFG